MIEIEIHGSGTAAPGLSSGRAQIGMASRQLKPKEAELLLQTVGADMFASENEHACWRSTAWP